MLKAKHDEKVNREELPESGEEPSPRAKTWLRDSGKKEKRHGERGGCVGLEKMVWRWAGGMRCQGTSVCPSVSALLPYALLSVGVQHRVMGDEF